MTPSPFRVLPCFIQLKSLRSSDTQRSESMAWRDLRLVKRLGLQVPVIQSPMAGLQASDLAIAVARGGGLGSIPCTVLSNEDMRRHVQHFREATQASSSPVSLCQTLSAADSDVNVHWQERLTPYYRKHGVEPAKIQDTMKLRMPFDESSLELVRELRPEVVSFHFGLPPSELLEGVKATDALVISSATTVREALWLEARGCDAVIAQGVEAGGHRGVFLPREDAGSPPNPQDQQYRNSSMRFPRQVGTIALVPQIVDAINVPVIASGGIGDARGLLAASALGAAAVQMGTVFLLADETNTSPLYRHALKRAASPDEEDTETAITNVLSGRPARALVTRVVRELGPTCAAVPEFPWAVGALRELQHSAEKAGDTSFSSFWSGQAVSFAKETSAESIVRSMAQELKELMKSMCDDEISSFP
ncbi:hypothetical protein BBJ28_00015357 [Nothophytophthora sp. Chile5]|nr:hypothetical protein BBJ28_00015357 [Nothophytophthora sp. Chile5]